MLAFDYGVRQIGLAVGQTLTRTARPLTTITVKDGQPNWPEILAHIAEWQPGLLIVGLPLNMDGTESDFCKHARKFARRIRGRSGCNVVMFDERLSTVEAKSETPTGKKPRRVSKNNHQSPVDALAACLILQSWLLQPEFAISP